MTRSYSPASTACSHPNRQVTEREGRETLLQCPVSCEDGVMKPLGVHHVSINVDDAEEAVAFYTGILGLTVRDDRPDLGFKGAWLDCGGQQLHLLELTVPDDRGQHFAIQVRDIEATISLVRSTGVEIGDPEPIASGQQAFLRDPSGNVIELHEPAK